MLLQQVCWPRLGCTETLFQFSVWLPAEGNEVIIPFCGKDATEVSCRAAMLLNSLEAQVVGGRPAYGSCGQRSRLGWLPCAWHFVSPLVGMRMCAAPLAAPSSLAPAGSTLQPSPPHLSNRLPDCPADCQLACPLPVYLPGRSSTASTAAAGRGRSRSSICLVRL